MFDGKAFGQEVVAAVKSHVDKSLAPILERLAALEAKEPAVDDDDLSAVKSDVESLRRAIAELPAPAETPELPDIGQMVSDAVAAIPAPQDGKSVTVEELAPMVAESVQKAVAAIREPKDGCGIKELLIDREGGLVATMDDGRMKSLGVVVGKDGSDVDMAAVGRMVKELVDAIPKPKDGKDGFSLKHFDVEMKDDCRTLVLSFNDSEQAFVVELGIPVMLYRGVFKEGQTYARGDTVTWGGSLWHCDVDGTDEKPDGPAKNWTLAAKRGRDGKDKA